MEERIRRLARQELLLELELSRQRTANLLQPGINSGVGNNINLQIDPTLSRSIGSNSRNALVLEELRRLNQVPSLSSYDRGLLTAQQSDLLPTVTLRSLGLTGATNSSSLIRNQLLLQQHERQRLQAEIELQNLQAAIAQRAAQSTAGSALRAISNDTASLEYSTLLAAGLPTAAALPSSAASTTPSIELLTAAAATRPSNIAGLKRKYSEDDDEVEVLEYDPQLHLKRSRSDQDSKDTREADSKIPAQKSPQEDCKIDALGMDPPGQDEKSENDHKPRALDLIVDQVLASSNDDNNEEELEYKANLRKVFDTMEAQKIEETKLPVEREVAERLVAFSSADMQRMENPITNVKKAKKNKEGEAKKVKEATKKKPKQEKKERKKKQTPKRAKVQESKEEKEKKKSQKNQEIWMSMLESLKKYKDSFGDCNVPKNYPDNPKLGHWAAEQRKLKSGKGPVNDLRKKRIEMLDEIGFDWTTKKHCPQYDARWMSMYERLKEYKAIYGDCMVPRDYAECHELGLWVNVQRKQYSLQKRGKKNALTSDRLELLEKLGFVWNAQDNAFNRWLKELEKFHAKHGHCEVPTTQSYYKLGMWVRQLRKQYAKKSAHLTQARIDALNKLNFEWKSDRGGRWLERYKSLVEFHKKHGHFNVAHTHNGKLAKWVNEQRRIYRLYQQGQQTDLMTERIEMLEKIGFVWEKQKCAKKKGRTKGGERCSGSSSSGDEQASSDEEDSDSEEGSDDEQESDIEDEDDDDEISVESYRIVEDVSTRGRRRKRTAWI